MKFSKISSKYDGEFSKQRPKKSVLDRGQHTGGPKKFKLVGMQRKTPNTSR